MNFPRKTRYFRDPAAVFYCRRSVLLPPVVNYYDHSIVSMTGSLGWGRLKLGHRATSEVCGRNRHRMLHIHKMSDRCPNHNILCEQQHFYQRNQEYG